MKSKRIIHHELRQAGASRAETARLAELARQLSDLKDAKRPEKKRWRGGIWRWSLATFAGLLVGAAIVAYAQTSLPGSWFYPVKRASENIAVAVDPNYRATLMMRRSQEVRELINQHASSQTVLATLADYRSQAAAYKTSNYAAFEYCKSNLQQAAKKASSTEQAAIASTLTSLQT